MSETNTRTADAESADPEDALHILLIEDNPGDARLIQEMLRGTEELAQRISPTETASQTPEITRKPASRRASRRSNRRPPISSCST